MLNCGICQQVKIEHQRPTGELQSLSILEWKSEDISIDFVMGLPRGKKGNDAIWVVVDRLTKSAFFFPMKMTNSVDKLAKLYVDEVITLLRASFNYIGSGSKVHIEIVA